MSKCHAWKSIARGPKTNKKEKHLSDEVFVVGLCILVHSENHTLVNLSVLILTQKDHTLALTGKICFGRPS